MNLSADAYKYAAGVLAAALVTLIGVAMQREIHIRKQLTETRVERDGLKESVFTLTNENQSLKSKGLKVASKDKLTRKETRADGSTVEITEEHSKFMEELLIETHKHFESQLQAE